MYRCSGQCGYLFHVLPFLFCSFTHPSSIHLFDRAAWCGYDMGTKTSTEFRQYVKLGSGSLCHLFCCFILLLLLPLLSYLSNHKIIVRISCKYQGTVNRYGNTGLCDRKYLAWLCIKARFLAIIALIVVQYQNMGHHSRAHTSHTTHGGELPTSRT